MPVQNQPPKFPATFLYFLTSCELVTQNQIPVTPLDSDRVLIDPSILVSSEAENRPQPGGYDEFEYFVSDAFAEVVRSNSDYVQDPTFDFFMGYLDFQQTEQYTDLRTAVGELETFSGVEAEKEYTENIDYEGVHDYFLEKYSREKNSRIGDILYDQFVFLFEQSWIPSRVKKSQNEVTDVPGLRKFVLDRDELDRVADQFPPEYQDKIQTLKNTRKWKWVGLGFMLGGATLQGPVGTALLSSGLAQRSVSLVFDP